MAARTIVAKAAELRDGATVKFAFDENGSRQEGFVIRRGASVHAYRNRCRHIPVTLDWVENRFLSRDRCYIQCATHGALYEIESGLCVSGPPAGETLDALDVVIEGGDIVVTLPDPPASSD